MLNVSEAFRTAIRNGAPQRALLRFSNATFGNDDISITGGGIRLTEIINGDTNLHYGLCSSARLEASLINRNGLLENFEFGEFVASLGVLVKNEPFNCDGVAAVTKDGNNVFTTHENEPYLRVNGEAAMLQPSDPIYALVIDGNILYAFGDNGFYISGEIQDDGKSLNHVSYQPLNTVSLQKIKKLNEKKIGIYLNSNMLSEFSNGMRHDYEFAPLGTFIAPKPSVLRKAVIEMEAEDRMQLFDSDLSDVEFNYPLTMTQAYYTLCQSVGVEHIAQNIPNGDLTLTSKPDLFDGATKRDVLGWIAEASATYARFNREGKLELTRFNETGVEYDEHDYVSASPSAYSVNPYGKLHIRNADSNIEQVVGEGENAYLIQDNPFLKPQALSVQTRDASAAESIDPATVILEALSEVGTYSPVAADTFADWTMQAGDVVTIKSGDDDYKTPLYTMNMTWKGFPRVTMESTGDEKAQPIPVFERRRYAGGRSAARAKEENEEFKTWAEFHIDEAEANIRLLTGSVTTATGEYINVEFELNGLAGAISSKAEKSEVTAEGQRVLTEAGELITASEGRIMQYVTVYDEQGNPLSSVQLALDAKANTADLTANYVTINALETTVSGLLKANELKAAISMLEEVDVNELTAGVMQTIDLIVNNGAEIAFDASVGGDLTVGGNLILGETAFDPADYATQEWVQEQGYLKSIPSSYATESWVIEQGYVKSTDLATSVTTKSLYIPSDGEITIPDGAELSLFGYTPRWNQMRVVKSADVTLSKRYLNLMLADGSTTGYIDVVTGVTLNTSPDTITYLYRGS